MYPMLWSRVLAARSLRSERLADESQKDALGDFGPGTDMETSRTKVFANSHSSYIETGNNWAIRTLLLYNNHGGAA